MPLAAVAIEILRRLGLATRLAVYLASR